MMVGMSGRLMSTSRNYGGPLPLLIRAAALPASVIAGAEPGCAQTSAEPGREIRELQGSDPQGFTWMLVCIGIIITCALALIGVTAFYAVKGKKSP